MIFQQTGAQLMRLVVVAALAGAGCVSPASGSGVTSVSPGMFAVSRQSVPSFYPMGMLRAQAMTDAVVHCKSLNKAMRAVEEKPVEAVGSDKYRRFHLTFACD